jgi:membrane fusion protein (multidrug efflux system)
VRRYSTEVIESESNSEMKNIAFRSRFRTLIKLLRNGETGKVLMTVPLKKCFSNSTKATYEIQDKKYVFLVDKNSVVHSQEIKIKGEIPDLYVIESGLTAMTRFY